MRQPPETERRPIRPPPDKIGSWSVLAQTHSGKLRLVEKQSGVDLFWRQAPGTPLRGTWHMRCLCELYRSLAAVCEGQDGASYEQYHPLPTNADPGGVLCMLVATRDLRHNSWRRTRVATNLVV